MFKDVVRSHSLFIGQEIIGADSFKWRQLEGCKTDTKGGWDGSNNLIPGHPETDLFTVRAPKRQLGYKFAPLITSANRIIGINRLCDPCPPRFISGFSFMIGGNATSLHER
uniref:Uncharacterized protein n=1 Tax=Candidatus Kentrum sp. TC TaxID=2126339 RepID=A0A450Y8I7_9GAMM|nr:MAG: hypothetical protein BECKTC1821D_GA0114238_100277 [Candidatus Kentron sp. TC]